MMLLRVIFNTIAFLLFAGCSSAPDIDGLPKEKHEVVVLGGSTYGVTVASALKSYDDTIDVLLVEPHPVFVTEPYLNLLLAGKIDESLVFLPFEKIAKRRGFEWIDSSVTYVNRDENLLVVEGRVIRYKRLIDARFHYLESDQEGVVLFHDSSLIQSLKERLAAGKDQRILIDATALPIKEKIRAEELYHVLKNSQKSPVPRHITLRQRDGENPGQYDLVITYPQYDERASVRFSDNFFVQFNEALETVAAIIREDYKGSFLPNMVKEEHFIYQNAETLQGIDLDTNMKKEGTEYLSKILKIQRDYM